ncbi:MAG: colanic acid biosynthesis glycosyltransferase WcaL [Chthoniobacterales bacterium]|nr:MAG: colanic acid biosynthesis glycosyltransferase WcaL [Chthoniobacterales bacterium]
MSLAPDLSAPAAERPVIACYCATFLKPEMLHIYRQITSLTRVSPFVIAQKREEAERFPFDRIAVVGKPAMHFLRRFWFKQVRDTPWQISPGEVKKLTGILDKARAELLHIYFGHIAVHLQPLIRSWPRPTVVSFHGADVMVDLEKPAYRAATQQMLDAVRLVLVRSESLGRALVAVGCPPEKIRIQRTGIPVEDIPFRPRVWPTDGSWKFLQASRLIEKKGLQVSLRAFAKFAAKYPAATFTIAGEGPLRNALGEEAAQLGLADKVLFPGFVSQGQLRELFYRSHLFLHPSETGRDGNQEGVPNSMLEAMASGLPVFATEHGGIPEAIENGKSGVLVREGDVAALARALIEMAANPEALSTIARHGAESVRRQFEQSGQTKMLEDYYFEAIGSSSGSGEKLS